MRKLKRVQVYLSDEVYDYLENRGKREGRKMGNLAAWLLTRAVEAEIAQEPKSEAS